MKTNNFIPLLMLLVSVAISSCAKDKPSAQSIQTYATKGDSSYYDFRGTCPDIIYVGDTVRFTARNAGAGATYVWHFGDGTMVSGSDSVGYHVYSSINHTGISGQLNIIGQNSNDSVAFHFKVEYPLYRYHLSAHCWSNGSTIDFNQDQQDSLAMTLTDNYLFSAPVPLSCAASGPRRFIILRRLITDRLGNDLYIWGQGEALTHGYTSRLLFTDTIMYIRSGTPQACSDELPEVPR